MTHTHTIASQHTKVTTGSKQGKLWRLFSSEVRLLSWKKFNSLFKLLLYSGGLVILLQLHFEKLGNYFGVDNLLKKSCFLILKGGQLLSVFYPEECLTSEQSTANRPLDQDSKGKGSAKQRFSQASSYRRILMQSRLFCNTFISKICNLALTQVAFSMINVLFCIVKVDKVTIWQTWWIGVAIRILE